MSSQVIKTTEELLHPILEHKGLELVDIEYVKEGKNWFLRIYIDKPGGIDITECGDVSEELSEKLDQQDPIKEAYFLEVSSPGVERPLKTKDDFSNNLNKNIYVKLYEPVEGEKEYEGILKDFTNNILTLEIKVKTRSKQIEIPYDKIAKARIAVTF
ncbi:ribosome maturation factor RimP [Virgibacillus halodenitrificans]|uniref:Ribosome maturation factor RimP n=1 Tax=Virgibacillus halodenitrificans TaxID=1482 RepID=A0AAC9NLE6_VIRHA|nr:ribosome maturation factor RimP [Virgibacillus halodenitrificans]APC48596.1 ribosome maturation factor RimP [Virgibacillus halodenitrificans]MBD1224201.1 ribosome maturation factor RimP [Virgibacillus halodenitrificans]MCG1028736.1 ribosome maturation factor RimP [Virgibacillus halodenitrificans]MCJ0931170.1 ribosome maturation factor RimP [Virgibacillus halodenitrificans]MYL56591.1 ribosome maturation factor RimP [Virgibacillus halodenitrificans]